MDKIKVDLDNIEGSDELSDPVLVEAEDIDNTEEELKNKKEELNMTEDELSEVKSDLDEVKTTVEELSSGVNELVEDHKEKKEAERKRMVDELSEADTILSSNAFEEMSVGTLRETYNAFDFEEEDDNEEEELGDPASRSTVPDDEDGPSDEVASYKDEMISDLSSRAEGFDEGSSNYRMFDTASTQLSETEQTLESEEDVDEFVDEFIGNY